jgi:formylglycine-generating enzyme required for sulfatase activity
LAPDDPDALRAAAWGWFALGRDDDALDTGFAAADAASEERRAEFEQSLARLEAAVASASSPEAIRALEDELSALEARRRELDARVDEQRDWRFPEDEPEARWWNNQLTKLIDGLERLDQELLAPEGFSPEHGCSVAKRLAFARRLEQGYAASGEYAALWEAALPSLRAVHPGLELEPQLGLVPIGRDPSTGLWEFAHLETGELPRREASGELALTEESGLVFVLLPGGAFTMGAQSSDPAGPNYDPGAKPDEAPVQELPLSPFFLSKYEMTQGQWLRTTGTNPSFHPPGPIHGGKGSLLHPVEMVSWLDADRVLGRLGLVLPTEAQWEYGARANTSTPWWTGAQRESLRGTVNLADRSATRAGAPWFTPEDWPDLDDGYPVHAPVDAFLPNPFGLFQVHGNLAEWCREPYAFYDTPARDGDGERRGGQTHRITRGGKFDDIAARARSAYRPGEVPEYRSHAVGLRPARAIDR